MRHLWILLAFAVVGLSLCGPPHFGAQTVYAQSTASPVPCGTPVYLPSPGLGVRAVNLASELNHLETCAASAVVGGVAPVGGTCIGVATPLPATINYTCPTPYPTPTNYPTPVATASAGTSVSTAAGPPATYTIGLNLGTCLGIVTGQAAYTCATPGPQATPSESPGTCWADSGSWPYTGAVDVTCSPTWTGAHIFAPSAGGTPGVTVEGFATASPPPCPGAGNATPAPQAALCVGPITGGAAAGNSVGGIAIGKQVGTNWGGTTASNSGPIIFVRNSGTVDAQCAMDLTSAGVMQYAVGAGCSSIILEQNSQVAGTLFVSGPARSECQCNSTTTLGYLGPVYTAAGATTASTWHAAFFSCTFSAATTCVPGTSFAGASVFASSTSIQGCDVASNTNSTVAFKVVQTSTTAIQINATASNSEAVTGVCWGT